MIYVSPYKTDDPQIVYNKLSKEDGVIVFGTGNCGAIAQLALKEANINVIALSDNNMHRWGTKIDGVEVIPPEKIKSDYGKLPVLIAVDLNFPYIRKQLNGLVELKISTFLFFFSWLTILQIQGLLVSLI